MLASSGDKHTTGTSIIVQIKLRALRRCACDEVCTRRTAPFDEFLRPPSFHYLVQSPIQFPSKRARINNVCHDWKIYRSTQLYLPAFFILKMGCIKMFHKAIFFSFFLSFSLFSKNRVRRDKRSDTVADHVTSPLPFRLERNIARVENRGKLRSWYKGSR